MKALDKSDYYKANAALQKVSINNLFARFVIEGKVEGKVFVDNLLNPRTFYVLHPYGISLLFGDSDNDTFNTEFKNYALNKNQTRKNDELMQAFPGDWDNVLKELFKDNLVIAKEAKETDMHGKIELQTRVNFKFNSVKFTSQSVNYGLEDCSIQRTNESAFLHMKGRVIPSNFWNSSEDFLKFGVGFSLYEKDLLASTAYSAFILDGKLEIGIETHPQFRGKGYARIVCSKLIDFCMKHNYEPVWACSLQNIQSYNLANKLGFEPFIYLPYYKLSN